MSANVRPRPLRNKALLILFALMLSLIAAFSSGMGLSSSSAQDQQVTAEDFRPMPGDCEAGIAINCLLLQLPEQVATVIDREANLLCSRGRVGPVGGTTCIAADAAMPALMVITDEQSGRVLLAALDPQERLGAIRADELVIRGQSDKGNLAVSVALPQRPSQVAFLATDGTQIGVEYLGELATEKQEHLDRIRDLPIESGNGG